MSTKITALPASPALTLASIFPVVQDPSGVPITQKATFTQLKTLFSAAFAPLGSGVTSFNARTGAVTLLLADVTALADSRYVLKAGDTMTGLLIAPGIYTGTFRANIVDISADYTVDGSNDYTLNCTAGTFNIFLPSLASGDAQPGQIFVIKNSGGGNIVVNGDSGETIDGATPRTVLAGKSIVIQGNPTSNGWVILADF